MEKMPTCYHRFKYRSFSLFVSTFMLIGACANTPNVKRTSIAQSSTETTTLNIWWEKGFNLEEDEAFRTLVSNWSKKTNRKVKLSFYTTSELLEKADRALQGQKIPDIIMSHKADMTLYPRLAWRGKLADVADLIKPIRDL